MRIGVLALCCLAGQGLAGDWYSQDRSSKSLDLYLAVPKDATPSLSAPIKLNGRSYLCRIDTASSAMIVPKIDAFAKDKRLKAGHSIGIACNPIEEEVISLSDLSFMGTEWHGVKASLREAFTNEAGWCAIGNSLMAGKQWVFDFGRQKLIQGPQKIARELHPLVLNQDGMPEIDITVDGVPARALWDSAADSTLIDRSFASKNKLNYSAIGKYQVWDSTGNSKDFEIITVKSLRVGAYELKDQMALLGNLKCVKDKRGEKDWEGDFDLVLGLSSTLNADWYFDFDGLKWALDVKEPQRLTGWKAKRNSIPLPDLGKARFVDRVGLFDEQKAKELSAVLDKFCKDWWAGARVVIVPSIGNWDLDDYAEKMGRSSLSAMQGNRALLILFDLSSGSAQVWVRDSPKGDLGTYFNEARIRTFIQPAQDDFKRRNYAVAMEKMILKLFRDWKG